MSVSVNDKVRLKDDKPKPPTMIGHRQQRTRAENPIVHSIRLAVDGAGGNVEFLKTYTVSEKTRGVDNGATPAPIINPAIINQYPDLFEIVEQATKSNDNE